MKKLYTLIVLVVPVIVSAQSVQQKASMKAAIADYMKSNLDDPSKYTIVSTDFATDSTSWETSLVKQRCDDKISKIESKKNSVIINNSAAEQLKFTLTEKDLATSFPGWPHLDLKIDSLRKDSASAAIELQNERSAFTPEFTGYLALHKFRGANKYGGVVLQELIFKFGPDAKTIRSVN